MDYDAALLQQNTQLGELLRSADLSTPVPTCPGWSLEQLFKHVGRGDRWAAQIVGDRVGSDLDPRAVRDGKPPSDRDEAVTWLHDSAQAIVDAVADIGPDAPVSTFLGPRPAVWWVRRRLHEATVHRADAAIALGLAYELAPSLAADGISEWLDRLVAEQADGRAASLDPSTTLHLHATDDELGSGGEWIVRAAEAGISWEHGHEKATTALHGRAVDIFLALVRRHPATDVDVQVIGDESVWSSWLERTPL